MSAGRPSTWPTGPDALPILCAGEHRNPRDGACVMEYVSVLAGERFGDHPRCVHPALAGLARAVNDRIHDDAMRSRLVLLVPDMIAIDERDPRVGPRIIATCLLAVAAIRPLPRSAAGRLEKASRRMRHMTKCGRGSRLWLRLRWAFAPPELSAREALRFFEDHAIDQADNDRDRKLYDLLCAAVWDCTQLDGGRRTDPVRPAIR
jgi:hypothetical protein